MTIRWNATNKVDDSDVQFATTLYSDGRVQFDYGPGNVNLTPTVGTSSGNGTNFNISSYNGQTTLTNRTSLLQTPLTEPGPQWANSVVGFSSQYSTGNGVRLKPPGLRIPTHTVISQLLGHLHQ